MKNKNIVIGRRSVDLFIESLNLVKTRDNLYINDKTKEYWKLDSYHSEMLEKDFWVLEKLPVMSIIELIEAIINTNSIEEAAVLSLIIYERDFDEIKDNRLIMIQRFENYFRENCITDIDYTKIRISIFESHLFDETNRESIINKSYSEIKNDAQFYKDISKRSKQLLSLLNEKNI